MKLLQIYGSPTYKIHFGMTGFEAVPGVRRDTSPYPRINSSYVQVFHTHLCRKLLKSEAGLGCWISDLI